MNDCIFCRIAAKQMPANLLYDSSDVIAFNDISPSAPVHVLIVPTKHIATFLDIEPVERDVLLQMTQVVQQMIRERELEKSGYRVVFNGGRLQHVQHLHWHLLSEGGLP